MSMLEFPETGQICQVKVQHSTLRGNVEISTPGLGVVPVSLN